MTQVMRAVEVRVPEQHVRASGRKAVGGGFGNEESVHWESACAEAGLHSETAIRSFTDRMLSPDTDSAFFFCLFFLNTIPAPVEAIETIIFSELIISCLIPLIQTYKNNTNQVPKPHFLHEAGLSFAAIITFSALVRAYVFFGA